MVRVLFVCLGNICRSPAAEGVFRALAERKGLGDCILADSAATHDYHAGRQPDPRAKAAAMARGIDISGLRARRATATDFLRFDYVLAMDEWNLLDLRRICPSSARDRLHRFLDFAPQANVRAVPDPYRGEHRDFEVMMDLLEVGARGLLDHIRRQDLSPAAGRTEATGSLSGAIVSRRPTPLIAAPPSPLFPPRKSRCGASTGCPR